ncbi:hypothetical protein NHQ30_002832 [Ciborinia camelliae]|nr:hypothetical protein NHQ30_002832 [Ciborinia camelliae]
MDCVTYLAGTMSTSLGFKHKVTDPNILQAVMKIRSEICEKIVCAQQKLHGPIASYHAQSDEWYKIVTATGVQKVCMENGGIAPLPAYYRKLSESRKDFSNGLSDVLSGKLQLDSSSEAGVDAFKDHFFCARLSDEDLPVWFSQVRFFSQL